MRRLIHGILIGFFSIGTLLSITHQTFSQSVTISVKDDYGDACSGVSTPFGLRHFSCGDDGEQFSDAIKSKINNWTNAVVTNITPIDETGSTYEYRIDYYYNETCNQCGGGERARCSGPPGTLFGVPFYACLPQNGEPEEEYIIYVAIGCRIRYELGAKMYYDGTQHPGSESPFESTPYVTGRPDIGDNVVEVRFKFKEGWVSNELISIGFCTKYGDQKGTCWGLGGIHIYRLKRDFNTEIEPLTSNPYYYPNPTSSNQNTVNFQLKQVSNSSNGTFPTRVRFMYETAKESNNFQTIEIGNGSDEIRNHTFSYEMKWFGQHMIKYQMYDECNGGWSAISELPFEAIPTCQGASVVDRSLSGNKINYLSDVNAWKLEGIGTSVVAIDIRDVNGQSFTDYFDHYESSFSQDIEGQTTSESVTNSNQISYDPDNLTLDYRDSKTTGKYNITFTKKSDRESCPTIPAMEIFIGGQDTIIESECPIEIPFDIESRIVGNELSTFETEIRSASNIIVYNIGGDGLTLKKGALLGLDRNSEVANNQNFAIDKEKSYELSKSYDDFGRLTGSGIVYYDNGGRIIQNQSLDLDKATVLATEVKEDEYSRPTFSTLVAPAYKINADDDLCESPLEVSGDIPFAYKEGFAKASDNTDYHYSHFSRTQLGKPKTAKNDEEYTLGWYYSDNNTVEPYVANTNYPFTQQEFRDENSLAEPKSTIGPGNVYRSNTGHQHTATQRMDAVDLDNTGGEDYQELQKYLNLRKEVHNESSSINGWKNVLIKTTTTDEKGENTVVVVTDKQSNVRYSYLKVGNTVKFRAYHYYDLQDRNIVSVSPNGVQQFQSGTSYSQIDKSTNEYDFRGRLAKTTSIDKGVTEFMYNEYGSIRFSQNAKQKLQATFSYTNYDVDDRPIASGEFNPSGTNLVFGSNALKLLLDRKDKDASSTNAGGLLDTKKKDEIRTYYDLPDVNKPTDFEQNFVNGAVSYTEKVGVSKTWYNYDERGRVVSTSHQLIGLGKRHIVAYDYNARGSIKQVSYLPESSDESFYHGYEYDLDGRLSKVVTSRNEIDFDYKEHITERFDVQKQCSYEYYTHGSLKRKVYGDDLQGEDYIYTVEGWLKAVNTFDPAIDPGHDGDLTHHPTAEDQFGYSLEYYEGDYEKEGIESLDGVYAQAENEYNGNIAAQAFHNKAGTNAYTYEYDEQNRLTKATWNDLTKNADNSYNLTPQNSNSVEGITYDENGNIKGFLRRDQDGNVLHDFRNKFQYDGKTNKLISITGYATYGYDALGQIQSINNVDGSKQDQYFEFNTTGLITGIYKDAALNQAIVEYEYDESGFRLLQRAFNTSNQAVETWYNRDADGRLMSIYQKEIDGTINQTEIPIYGDGKIAMASVNDDNTITYAYELKDHLGSVRNVIIADGKVNGQAQTKTVYAVDYYPMGYSLRKYDYGGGNDRYGYQGEYAEDEVDKIGYNTFEARFYDPITGRWLSTDPEEQLWSPYAGMGGQYTIGVDPDGRLFFVPILIGAAVGGALNLGFQALNGNINSVGDGFAAFGIGALAGGAAVLAPQLIGAAFGVGLTTATGAVAGGAIPGAIAGGIGGAISGVGNSAYFQRDRGVGEHLLEGLKGGLFGAATGGLVGGVSNALGGKPFLGEKASKLDHFQKIAGKWRNINDPAVKRRLAKMSAENSHRKGIAEVGKLRGHIEASEELANRINSMPGKSADEIAQEFINDGYEVTIKQSTHGSKLSTQIKIKGHGEIANIQVHPGGGRHIGAYYKISTTTVGKIKLVNPTTYKPTPGEKATILYHGL